MRLVETGSDWLTTGFELVSTSFDRFLVMTGFDWFRLVSTGFDRFLLVSTRFDWLRLVETR